MWLLVLLGDWWLIFDTFSFCDGVLLLDISFGPAKPVFPKLWGAWGGFWVWHQVTPG